MNQTKQLIITLKKVLKAKDITYKNLSKEMGLSEATIKRMFSKKSFSLVRLEEICNTIDLDFYELAKIAKKSSETKEKILTIEQEKVLAENQKLLTFFYFLLNGWSVPLVIEEYKYSEKETTEMLLKLDQIGLIELHPNNRIKLLVSTNVFWNSDGPLWKLYVKNIFEDYFDYPFELQEDTLIFSPGQFSPASIKKIRKGINKLVEEFNTLAEMDSTLPMKGRHSSGLIIGFRPWVFSMIAALKR